MQTARDYLADQNLAIRGARGKFSHEAKAALAAALKSGIKFSDWDENGRILPVRTPRGSKRAVVTVAPSAEGVVTESPAPKPKQFSTQCAPKARVSTPVREETAIKVVDRFGITIKVDHCSKCSSSVRMCRCAHGPTVGAWLSNDAESIELITA